MRADRLISSLILLQANRQLTGRELARRLEVSERTIHRDMEALSAAGVPVYALRGAYGGWKLDENWRTNVPGLEDEELQALLMAQPRVVGDPKLEHAAERALTKLLAAMPAAVRDRASRMRQRVYIDAKTWREPAEDLPWLPVVQDAIARDRKLGMRYAKLDQQEVERTVDPLGLVAKGSIWYLAAQTPRGMRTYRTSRITEARVLDQPSERPIGFDLAVFWKRATEELEGQLPRFEATLRLRHRAAEQIRLRCAVTPVPDESYTDEDWTTLCVRFDSEGEACFVVLGLGAEADVLAPAGLKQRVDAAIAAMISQRAKPGNSR